MVKKREYCPHCDDTVSWKTFKRHRGMYYDSENDMWKDVNLRSVPVVDEGDSYVQPERVLVEDLGGEYANVHNDIENLVTDSNVSEPSNSIDCTSFLEEDKIYFQEKSDETSVTEDCGARTEYWDDITEEELLKDFELAKNIQETPVIIDTPLSDQKYCIVLLNWLCIFLCFWWTRFGISENGIAAMVTFLKTFFSVSGRFSPWLGALATAFPGTLYLLKKKMGLLTDKFTKYIVCPTCSQTYLYESCFEQRNGVRVPKLCSHIEYPNHPQRKFRKPCGASLFRKVVLRNGKTHYYPHKVYCYTSVISSLKKHLQRKDFAQKCEQWRQRDVPNGMLADIYDGRIWREFQEVDGQPFLSSKNNYGLQLNIDWFQPFKHTPFSVGAIYAVLLNLPRTERYKKENTILIGIIPGPREPSLNINAFLEPLVDELNALWTVGLTTTHHGSPFIQETFKAALICTASDIPATRKLCGFVSFMAKHGCSKCEKEFCTGAFGTKPDFGGFASCPLRNNLKHREQVAEIIREKTKSNKAQLESKYGVRYSALMELPYFDCVRFHVIDPLHNLFLGTGKHLMKKIWVDNMKISKSQLEIIQKKVDNTKTPADMGRIPQKISSNFGGFTAEQWKNWIVVFSIFSLKGILPRPELECWRLFVLACQLLCAPVISIASVGKAHSYLMRFCREFERLYGSNSVTPNMHFHCHLADNILDYGPIYAFWTFPYERMNGVLSGHCANQKSVEIQIMRKFTNSQFLMDMPLPGEFCEDFQQMFGKDDQQATATEINDGKSFFNCAMLSQGEVQVSTSAWSDTCHFYMTTGAAHIEYFDDTFTEYLKEAYLTILGDIDTGSISGAVKCYNTVDCGQMLGILGSENSRHARSSHIIASWPGNGGRIDTSGDTYRPGIIEYFISQSILVHEKICTFIFAKVRWFQEHPEKKHYGEPVEVWCRNLFELTGPATFLPIQRIHGKFVAGLGEVRRENVMCVMPRPFKMYL